MFLDVYLVPWLIKSYSWEWSLIVTIYGIEDDICG